MEQLEKKCWRTLQPRSPLHQHLKMKIRENEPRQALTLPALNPGSYLKVQPASVAITFYRVVFHTSHSA